MKAAIYARKSTDQNVADEEKSTTRQIEHGRAYAVAKGWAVSNELIFVDDGISGALFGDQRPGLMRLLNALSPPRFDVLILSEVSRIGREQTQTGHVFGLLHRAGVKIFSYLDDREIALDTAIDKVMLNLTAFAAELEREKARQRTRDGMLLKARAGHVTGGRVFGYDNICSACARVIPPGAFRCCKHGQTERRINAREAAGVLRIFELAALGHGLRVTAHTVNAEHLPAPRPQRGRPAGWAPSSVRDVLSRPIYRGVIEYDRIRRNNERKQFKRNANPQPIRVEAPHLRIVSEELAATVDAHRADRRERYVRATDGKLLGRPAPKAVKHVLSGLLRCPCGASFEAQGASYGRRKGGVYVCSAARRKGRAVCASEVHLPAADTERAVLDRVEAELLNMDVFGEVLDVAVERLTREGQEMGALVSERESVDRELRNLIVVAAAGAGETATLVAEIKRREKRKTEIDRSLSHPVLDREGLRRALDIRLTEWKGLLRSRPTHGQTVLRHLLDGRITVGAPEGDQVPCEAQPNLSGLLGGILSDKLASPTGAVRDVFGSRCRWRRRALIFSRAVPQQNTSAQGNVRRTAACGAIRAVAVGTHRRRYCGGVRCGLVWGIRGDARSFDAAANRGRDVDCRRHGILRLGERATERQHARFTAEDVQSAVENCLHGEDHDEWDLFLGFPINDPYLESVRQRCIQLWDEDGPEPVDGRLRRELEKILQELRQ